MADEAENDGVLVDGEGKTVELDENGELPNQEQDEVEVKRPEWLPEKFKSPEDLAKSYSNLEKTLKDKGKLAPDEYAIDDLEALPIDVESEEIKAFTDFASNNNLSNAQYNAVLSFAKENGIFDAPNYDEEIKALGGDSDKIINTLKNFSDTRLSPQEQEVLENLTTTAESTKLLYKLIRMNNASIPAKPGDANIETKENVEKKLSTLLSDPTIRSDMSKKKEAEELAKKLASM